MLFIIAAVGSVPLVALVSYYVAYFTVPPTFSAVAVRQPDGDFRIEIDPNFVVFSVYSVKVNDSNGVLAQRDEPREGSQAIVVPGPKPTGSIVTVTCDLVYDRPMPSMMTRSAELRLP